MGSVELFPRTQPRRAAIASWRAQPVAAGAVRVREARLADYTAVRGLQIRAGAAACTLRQFESRLRGFPAGQMVAVCDGHVVGYAAALVVDWDMHGNEPTWQAMTGEGFFTTHDPEGATLFGADMVVDASPHAVGAARALLQARRKLCRRLNLRRAVVTPALAGYSKIADRLTPEQFATRIVWGDVLEPMWGFLANQGFQFCGMLRGFTPPGDTSCGHAGLFAWLNPLHAPPRPPATERRCA